MTAAMTRSSSHGAGGTVSSINRRMSRVSSRSTINVLPAVKMALQALDGSVKPASGRRAAGSRGDRQLGDRHAKVEMEQDNQAVLVGQTSQCALQVQVAGPRRAGRDDVVSSAYPEPGAHGRYGHFCAL